ncbi:MAG: hypothetical protein ACLTSS_02560 [Phocaeicola coprocola]
MGSLFLIRLDVPVIRGMMNICTGSAVTAMWLLRGLPWRVMVSICLLSYVIGQKKYPIRYRFERVSAGYVLLAALLYVIVTQVPVISNIVLRLVFRSVLIVAIFLAYILKKDLPLKTIPFVNRFVK